MAKTPKKPPVLAKFSVPMKVEIRQPEFEALASLAALDLKRLQEGNHKIEIGFIKGGCCRKLVRAVINDGMVTGCEVEPCKGSGKAGKALVWPFLSAEREWHEKVQCRPNTSAIGRFVTPKVNVDMVAELSQRN